MDIKNRYNSPNFESIKLKRNEAVKVKKLIQQYKMEKSPVVFNDLIDVFTPHIEKESTKLAGKSHDPKDVAQDLYLNLIELFTKSNEQHHPVTTLVSKLNTESANKYQSKKVAHKEISQLTPEENMKLSYRHELDCPETEKEQVDRLINTTETLHERDRVFLDRYRRGDDKKTIAHNYGLIPESVRNVLNDCVRKMKQKHDPNTDATSISTIPITWKL